MKAVKLTIGAQEYHLLFNARAMFAIEEQFGGAGLLTELVQAQTAESFDVLCRSVGILAEQGELVRRTLGYDQGMMPDVPLWSAIASPMEVVSMQNTLCKAITLGYGREIPSQGEVDLGLVELKKTKK